jgi:hypothetical protein
MPPDLVTRRHSFPPLLVLAAFINRGSLQSYRLRCWQWHSFTHHVCKPHYTVALDETIPMTMLRMTGIFLWLRAVDSYR